MLAALAAASVSYCISKLIADWRNGEFGTVVWGALAALSGLIFLGLLLIELFVKSLTI